MQPYLEAMRLRPDQADGFIGLSRVLVKLGRIEEVNNALLAAFGDTEKPSLRNWRLSDGKSGVADGLPHENRLSL